MLRFALLTSLLVSANATLSSQAPVSAPYLDPSLSPHARAVDLAGRMTLDEKASQMINNAPAIPRLGVPAYNFWNEGLHGVARAGYATMFPQAIGMAATFDAPLLQEVGDVIATEARAKNNDALRHGNHGIYFGLTFWSPNINIFRDPRWGRGQETYGEDPFLTGTLADNFIRGLQGDDARVYKVIATPKHFAVHSGPENVRHRFNVDPSPHDLWDTYLPQFRTAIVDAKAGSIMCSYNAVDHTPACGSTFLLQDILRDRWKFDGFVTSDCGAIDDFYMPDTHRTAPDAEHASRDALLAGTDTSCSTTYRELSKAVHDGLVKEADVDRGLVRLLEARIRLGQFDPPSSVPYTLIPFSQVHSPAHIAIARRTAQESIVLLKNSGVLPLDPAKKQRIAVIGPNAASVDSLEGNYNGTPHSLLMPVDAITAALLNSTVTYAPGAPLIDGFTMPVPRTLVTAAGSTAGWHAEYYNHPAFTGAPARTSTDPEIDFDWTGANPLSETILRATAHPAGFAVRWTGTLHMPVGTYTFHVATGACDGCGSTQHVRVLVDGAEVAASSAPRPHSGPVVVDGFTGIVNTEGAPAPEFRLTFSAEASVHRVQVDFVRDTAERGSGIAFQFTPTPDMLLPDALQAANHADVIVAMLGLSPRLEGEELSGIHLPGFAGGDRTDLALPASQQRLLQSLLATGKPVAVVLLNGSAIAANLAAEKASAILDAWYGGEAGSSAIADVLTGKVNPSGRLPVTFYRSVHDLPSFDDYAMRNRTYRYFTGDPLYRFGFGLSYTRFQYVDVHLSTTDVQAGSTLTAGVTIRNTGARAGDEVVELYLTPPPTGNGGLSPRLRLAGVQRVSLRPGESKSIGFALTPRLLSEVDAAGKRSVQPGLYHLSVGGAQPGDTNAATAAQTAAFHITGSSAVPD